MKLPCEMVQDLLPLYHDGVCSEVSKTLVREHLTDCEECSKMLAGIDAEIEVPKMEADAAKPLASIRKVWKKSRWKAFLLGLTVTCVVAYGLWWLLFGWYCITIEPEEIIIGEQCVLENGIVVLEHAVPYPAEYPYDYITEDGIRYSWYTRPIFWDKIENSGSTTSYWNPEEQTWLATESQEKVEPVAWYFGEPGSDDLVLFWEKGMELPPASERAEERYKQLEEAFEAPNAPEKPEVIDVIDLPPTSEGVDKDRSGNSVYETVACGADPAENAE